MAELEACNNGQCGSQMPLGGGDLDAELLMDLEFWIESFDLRECLPPPAP